MENKATYTSTAIRYDLYIGAALIILSLVFYLLGMVDPETGQPKTITSIISWAVTIIGMVMAIMYYKSSNEGYLSVGNAVMVGLMTGLIAGVITAVWNYIFFTFIDPQLIEIMRDNAIDQAMARPGVDENAEEMIEKWVNTMTSPGVIALFSVFFQVLAGLVVGLIGGLILKNNRPEFTV